MSDTRLRSVRLPLELDAKLEELALEMDRSVSWVIVMGLQKGLGLRVAPQTKRAKPSISEVVERIEREKAEKPPEITEEHVQRLTKALSVPGVSRGSYVKNQAGLERQRRMNKSKGL